MSNFSKWLLVWIGGVAYYLVSAEIHKFIDSRYGEGMAIGYACVAFGVPTMICVIKGSEV